MTAFGMNTSTVRKFKKSMEPGGFYSVEFAVDKPHPLYQFKIWRSESNPMFVVVKQTSAVLPKLKAGNILNMTYYSRDTQCPKKADRNPHWADIQRTGRPFRGAL